jgi:hypothetical protein
MKLRGKARQRTRRQARGTRPTAAPRETLSYTEKSWEPLPPDTDEMTKRVWDILKPPGAPPVVYGPAVPRNREEGR